MTSRVTPAERRLFGVLAGAHAFLLAAIVVLFVLRERLVHDAHMRVLFLNVVLAVIPFPLSIAFVVAARRRPRWLGWVVGAAWLAFLPNAPYLTTAIEHWKPSVLVVLWFDGLLFALLGAAGLALGLTSIAVVHREITRLKGRTAGWVVAIGANALAGVGVRIGRVARANSWDLITNPALLVRTFVDPVPPPLNRWFVNGLTAAFAAANVALYLIGAAAYALLRTGVSTGVRTGPD